MMATQTTTNTANPATTNPSLDNQNSLPSFADLWAEELRAMGFEVEEDGVRFNSQLAPKLENQPQAKDSEGETEGKPKEASPTPTFPATRPAYITATLEAVITNEINKVLAEEPMLNQGSIPQATREYLKNLPPEQLSPETVRAALYMFFGNYAAKRLRYEQTVMERSQKPTDAIPNPIKQKAEQYAQIWGVDANELLQDLLKEGNR